MPEKRALILAGGLGSRLRPLTFVIPKPLLPVGELPIIEILIRQLAHHRVDRISIAVGRAGSLIQTYCGDGEPWGVHIDYLREEKPLGTAGPLGLLEPLAEDRLLVVNGDTLTDLDFGGLFERHDPSDAMTVAVSRRDVELRFGVAEADGEDRLVDYKEKPVLSYTAGMGVYVVTERARREYLRAPEPIDMPELIQRLLRNDEVVRVVETDAYWLDVGHVEDLETAEAAVGDHPGRFLPD